MSGPAYCPRCGSGVTTLGKERARCEQCGHLFTVEASTPPPPAGPFEFDLSTTEGETVRGRRVSLELLEEIRTMLDQLTPSAQLKIAAVCAAYGTGMSERTAMLTMERIVWVRQEHGWKDPDVLRAIQPRPKPSGGE